MYNKVRLALLLIFAALTFYQFYTFARAFNLTDLIPRDTSGPTVLYGVDVATRYSAASTFNPSILLLALNITLWFERPNRVRREPLILAFIANLAIVIIRIGIAAPALKRAATAPQNTVPDTWTLVALFARWNAVYLIAATISGLIMLGVLVHVNATDQAFMSSLRSRLQAMGQFWDSTPIAAKTAYLLLVIFALLTFYQLYMYATLVTFSPAVPPDLNISSLNLPAGPKDVVISSNSPSFSFDPSLLLLALNILLWIRPPKHIGRTPLIAAFIANLAIVVLRIGLANPAIELASAPERYAYVTPYREIQALLAQWNRVYLVAATVSSAIVVGVLAYFYAADQAFPVPVTLRSMATWQFWKAPATSTTIEIALLLVFGLLIFYQFFTLASVYQFGQLFGQQTSVLIGTFIAPSSSPARFDPSLILIVLNIILLIKPLDQSWRAPLVVILIANLAVVGIQQGIILPIIRQEIATSSQTFELYNSTLRWRFVRLLAATISALGMIGLLLQIIRRRWYVQT